MCFQRLANRRRGIGDGADGAAHARFGYRSPFVDIATANRGGILSQTPDSLSILKEKAVMPIRVEGSSGLACPGTAAPGTGWPAPWIALSKHRASRPKRPPT